MLDDGSGGHGASAGVTPRGLAFYSCGSHGRGNPTAIPDRKWQEPAINAPTAILTDPTAGARGRFSVSITTLVWAALILAVGLSLSAAVGLYGSRVVASPYQSQISPVVSNYNTIVRDWNAFVEDFNNSSDSAQNNNHDLARKSLQRTSRLGNAAQVVIAEWNTIQPPERYRESHALAGQAMRATQSAFLEMSSYLEEVVRFGIAFSDRADRATSKLEEASRLLEQARAAALAGR